MTVSSPGRQTASSVRRQFILDRIETHDELLRDLDAARSADDVEAAFYNHDLRMITCARCTGLQLARIDLLAVLENRP